MISWIGVAAQAACPATNAKLSEELDRAEGAFASLDVGAFEVARAELATLSGCLGESPGPALVARLHGVFALAAVVAKDDEAAAQALQSARAADATWDLPPAVPEGHRLRGALATLPPASGAVRPVSPPAGTRSVVDGHPADVRPVDRPALIWLRQDDGFVPYSALLPPGAPDPDLSRYAVTEPPPPVVPPPPTRSRSARAPLTVASGLVAVGSGLLYGGASLAASRYADPATPYAELDGLRARANTLTAASAIGLGAALGLGAAAVASPEAP